MTLSGELTEAVDALRQRKRDLIDAIYEAEEALQKLREDRDSVEARLRVLRPLESALNPRIRIGNHILSGGGETSPPI
jgi:prefoldin subunit 5